jgi:putative hydrolase of the HAD superfamily
MFNWQEVDTVLLDMEGTLLDLHYDNYFWEHHLPSWYSQKHGLCSEETREQLIATFRQQIGKLEFYCTNHWSKELNVDLIPLKREVVDKISFLPGANELLALFKQRALNTALITNAHRDVLEIKQNHIGIENYVDESFASHDFGYPKEDARFWPLFQEAYAFDPERTVMIDDNLTVLKAAATFGIRYCIQPLKPDSQRPANTVNDSPFLQIHSLHDLLPATMTPNQ